MPTETFIYKARLQIKKIYILGFLFEQAVIIKCMSFSNFIYQDLSNVISTWI